MQENVLSMFRVDHVLGMAGNMTRDFNCWGATMFIEQAKDRLGWVHNPEISQWLQDDFEPIPKKDLREGDILALFQKHSEGLELVHTAVYIGDKKFVHKLGQNVATTDTLKGVIGHYANSANAFTLMRRK